MARSIIDENVYGLILDLFVIYKLSEKTHGTFLEFGTTNGLNMSNTYLLENKFK